MTQRGGLWITQRPPRAARHALGLTSHNGSSVYSRQFSFLPTIMREIESQEMFVFLSIRPNNNTIPRGLHKHLSSKDSPENLTGLQAMSGQRESDRGNHTSSSQKCAFNTQPVCSHTIKYSVVWSN